MATERPVPDITINQTGWFLTISPFLPWVCLLTAVFVVVLLVCLLLSYCGRSPTSGNAGVGSDAQGRHDMD